MNIKMMVIMLSLMTPLFTFADVERTTADCLLDHNLANLPLNALDDNQQQQAVECLTLSTKQQTGW